MDVERSNKIVLIIEWLNDWLNCVKFVTIIDKPPIEKPTIQSINFSELLKLYL